MLLVIDCGNTLTDFALFDNDDIVAKFRVKTDTHKTKDQYQVIFKKLISSLDKNIQINKCILSSVVPSLEQIWVSIVRDELKIKTLVLGPGLKSGLQLKVDEPLTVGADLIADAVGAKAKYGNNLFIADLGTASKYIYIDENGAFAGLVIAPGFGISLASLVNKTAILPEVNALRPKHVIGTNTKDCMNSGIVNGTLYEIYGFANAFEKEVGHPLKKILTGGYSQFISEYIDKDYIYDENVLLHGLNDIARRNK